jgi:hypothetical protein
MISIETSSIPPDKVVLKRDSFLKLLEKVREIEEVEVTEVNFPSIDEIMKLQMESGAFDFLMNENEDIYTVNDLKVKYK